MASEINVYFKLPTKLQPLLTPMRYKVLWGGRGSAKSETVARVLILLAMQRKLRILCTREVMNSLRDSVHSTLKSIIYKIGASSLWEITDRSIKCPMTGAEFIFAGLNKNTDDSVKSIADINICWVEEGSNVSQDSLDKLIPSIRGDGPFGAGSVPEIWVTFNPHLKSDPVYVKFITNRGQLDNAIVIRINHDDNPFFPEVLRKEMEQCRENDLVKYNNIWLGETLEYDNALIYAGKYVSYTFEPKDHWSPMFGCDLGFANDPTVLLKCWADDENLYIEHELYQVGLDIEMMPAMFDTIPGARDHTIYTDCSRPETINHMKRNGYPRCLPVRKWDGSVKDGIERMRAFRQIVIHPRCPNTLEEFGLYSYKVDSRTKLVLPDILHTGSNAPDAARYAIQPLILGGKAHIPDREPAPVPNQFGRYGTGVNPNAWLM